MKTRISEQGSQVLVAMSIVSVLGVIAIALVIAGCISGQWAILGPMLGTDLGALAVALNAPTGVSAALTAAKTPAPPPASPEAPTSPQQ